MKFFIWGAAGLIVLLLHLFTGGNCAEAVESGGKGQGSEKPLVIAFTPQSFFNVDPRDAIGAARVWINGADRRIGNPTPSIVKHLQDQNEVETSLANNDIDIFISIADEFIPLRERFNLLPVLATDYGRNFYDELLLLVRADSGITTVDQLRGKSLRIEGGQKGTIPMKWLHSLMHAHGVSGPSEFFGNISEFPKASQIIMPVFFGQSDCCIASLTSFETMSELNPQLGKKLKILEKSPGFATGIIAVRKGTQSQRRDAMVEALKTMDGDPKGKQVLTIFRINRLVPFRPEHLASVEKLFRDLYAHTEPRDKRK